MTDRILLILCISLLAIGLFIYFVFIRSARKQSRRRMLRSSPFPEEWDRYLRRNVPLYQRLPESLRKELQGHILVFLDEKHFEGCGGVQITDEIRFSVAAQACLLILNRETGYYPGLTSILVYPETYFVKEKRQLGLQEFEEETWRHGESWSFGTIVLAWDQVKRGAKFVGDGYNVVLHEFAHQLDQEDGSVNGTPVLQHPTQYRNWARILGKELEELQASVMRNQRGVLDPYGSQNPAEFFAVATETFFEKPAFLKEKTPELYEELRKYYNLNPIEWLT